MAAWYVTTSKGESGPVTSGQLKKLAKTGKINAETMIRREDRAKPCAAGSIVGLFKAENPPTLEPPAPQPEVEPTPVPPPRPAALTEPAGPPPETPVDVIQVADTGSVPTVRRGKSKAGLFALLIVALIATGGLGFAGARFLAPNNAPPETGNQKVAKTPADTDDSSADDVEEREKAIEKLEEEVDALKKDKRQLEEEKENVQREIDNLVSLLEELKQWQATDIVLANPGQIAVGLRDQPDRSTQLAMKAQGTKTALIVKAAIRSRIPVVPADPELVRRLHRDLEAGATITGDLETALREYHGPHEFAPLKRGEEGEWVTFWDKGKNRRVFGLFSDASHDELVYVTLNGESETVPRSNVIPGTALKGTYEEVIHSLDESHFLDYCLMRVAQELQSPADRHTTHALAVTVRVDDIDRSLSSSINDPSRPRLLQPGESIEASGGVAWLVGGLFAADYLFQMADHSRNLADARARRADARQLENAVAYLEDEVYSKLNKLGVTTYEHEYVREVLEAREITIDQNSTISELGREALLTHSLVVDVKKPQRRGKYHVAIRLVDLITGTNVFSASADRIEESLEVLARQRSGYRQYHLDSGRLAVLESEELRGLETPPLVDRPTRPGPIRKQLVYVENDAEGSPAFFRPLFSKQRSVLKPGLFSEKSLVNAPQDAPANEIFRYLVCRTMQKCLPMAGRIVEARGSQATVSIGSLSGIKRGDSLRVLRYFDDGYKEVNLAENAASREQRLPVRLNVTDAHDHHCEVAAAKTGFEDVWYSEFKLLPGDLVVPSAVPQLAVGFVPPVWEGVSGEQSFRRELQRQPGKLNRLYSQTGRFALRFANKANDAFKNLNVATRVLASPFDPRGATRKSDATVQEKQVEALRKAGASHAIVGEIRLKRDNLYDLRLGILPLDTPEGTYELKDSLDVTLHEGWLPK